MSLSTKKRLYEIMGHVNPDFRSAYEENLILEAEGENVQEPAEEPQEEITPEDQERAQKLNQEAETATPNEADNEKPVIQQQQKGIDIKVTVPMYKKRIANENLASLKKLARKLHLPEPKITIGNPYQKKIKVNKGTDLLPYWETYLVDVYDIHIESEDMFKIAGNNKLVAIVDNITGGSVEIDPQDRVPEQYLHRSGDCDYCHQERYRGKNFIVKQENGQYKRLGSSCVKKYLGVDPSKYIKALNYLNDFMPVMDSLGGEDWGEGGGGGGGHRINQNQRLIDKDKVITVLHDIITKNGYIKREYEEEEHDRWGRSKYNNPPIRKNPGKATADVVEKIMDNHEEYKKMPIDKNYVNSFLNFLHDLKLKPENLVTTSYGDQYDKNARTNEFLQKLKNLANPETNLRVVDIGFLGYAISYFEEAKKKATEKPSEWIGNVGEKVKLTNLTLSDHKSGEGAYGVWNLWFFKDENGNYYKKFGELSPKFIIKKAPEGAEQYFSGNRKGDVYAFTAEIKKHDEDYNGVKTTMLGRLSKY